MLKELIKKDARIIFSKPSIKFYYLIYNLLFITMSVSIYFLNKSQSGHNLSYYLIVLPVLLINIQIRFMPMYELLREHLNGGLEYFIAMGINLKDFIIAKTISVCILLVLPLSYLFMLGIMLRINAASMLLYIISITSWSYVVSKYYITSLNLSSDPSSYIDKSGTITIFITVLFMYLPKLISINFSIKSGSITLILISIILYTYNTKILNQFIVDTIILLRG